MLHDFATTRVVVPPVAALAIPRPRLIERLAPEAKHKLCLLSAPAGFGKTTLLGQWVARWKVPAAYVALDRDDNDPGKFFAMVTAAVRKLIETVGASGEELDRQFELTCEGDFSLVSLVNWLSRAAPAEFALMFDDYHLVEAETIHVSIRDLIRNLPLRCHLFISSRTTPPLPLASLRAKGEIVELRAEDLRFTCVETAAFFKETHGLQLTDDEMTRLERQSEGWIASLELVALSLRDKDPVRVRANVNDFGGTHRDVWDYFMDEVYLQQPEHIREFLLKTSVLSRLCASLCNEVTGMEDSRSVLEQLHQQNLLIALGGSRRWYRYPHLLADFLRHASEQEMGVQGAVEIHRKASGWFERMGFTAEAANHAMAARDARRMMILFNTLSDSNLDAYLTWQHGFAELPDEVLYSQPDLCLNCAWAFLVTGDIEATTRPIKIAEQAFRVAGNRAKLGRLYTLRSVVSRLEGDTQRAIDFGRLALECLAERDTYIRAVATYSLALAYGEAGQLETAERTLREVPAMLAAHGDWYPAGIATASLARLQLDRGDLLGAEETLQQVIHLTDPKLHDQVLTGYTFLGLLHYERNRLDTAKRYLLRSVEGDQFRKVGRRPMGCVFEWDRFDVAGRHLHRADEERKVTEVARHSPIAYLKLASVFAADGHENQAMASIDKALTYADMLRNEKYIRLVKAHRARLLLRQGKLAPALKWHEELGSIAMEDAYQHECRYEYLTVARLLIARANSAQGSHLLAKTVYLVSRWSAAAERCGDLRTVIESEMLKSIAYWLQGDRGEALETLSHALSLAEPQHFVRTFLDEGEQMPQLLAYAAENRVLPEYVACLLAEVDSRRPPKADKAEGLVATDELSKREVDVLRLVAQGVSTEEVAERLCLSRHTVRSYVKSILGKLAAHNRIQAVERARTLGLI